MDVKVALHLKARYRGPDMPSLAYSTVFSDVGPTVFLQQRHRLSRIERLSLRRRERSTVYRSNRSLDNAQLVNSPRQKSLDIDLSLARAETHYPTSSFVSSSRQTSTLFSRESSPKAASAISDQSLRIVYRHISMYSMRR